MFRYLQGHCNNDFHIIVSKYVFFRSSLFAAIEIGFTVDRITHMEEFSQFDTAITKNRVSEQTFQLQVELSTASTTATRGVDFNIGGPENQNETVVRLSMTPDEGSIAFAYRLLSDNTPENLETFGLVVSPDENSPPFGCSPTECYSLLTIEIEDDDGEL